MFVHAIVCVRVCVRVLPRIVQKKAVVYYMFSSHGTGTHDDIGCAMFAVENWMMIIVVCVCFLVLPHNPADTLDFQSTIQ